MSGNPGDIVVVNFWDLAGHPDYFDVRNEFYKDAQAVCFIAPSYCCDLRH